MNTVLKLLVGLVVPVLALTGCTATPEVQAAPTTSVAAAESSEPEVVSCDPPEVDPLTLLGDASMNSFLATCPTDKTTPEIALAALDTATELEPCMLVEVNEERERYKDNTTGFPRATDPYRLKDGKYKVMVIPVDWPDLKDEVDPMSFLPEAASMYSKWYEAYSGGRLTLDIEVYPEWIEMATESEKFSQSEFEQNANQWGDSNRAKIDFFWNQALGAADPLVDFTGVEIVMFVVPRFQDVISEFNLWPPGNGSFQTDEAVIERGFTPGSFHFRPDNQLWAFWVHETLHYLKMPDLYWVDLNSFRAQPTTFPAPNYGYDVLNTANELRRINSWLLWLMDWLDPNELSCYTAETFVDGSVEIASNHIQDDRTKAVMLKLSEHELLLIESHRLTEFDAPMNRSRDGVLIQYVDTHIPHGQGAMTILAPKGRTLLQVSMPGGNQEQVLDAVFYEGNSIDIAGYHITVNQANEDSDLVSISKIPDWVSGSVPEYVCINMENRERNIDPENMTCPLVF